jgi:hypothetical protein
MTAALLTDAFCQVRGLYHFSCFLFSFGTALTRRVLRGLYSFSFSFFLASALLDEAFCQVRGHVLLGTRSIEVTFCRGHIL